MTDKIIRMYDRFLSTINSETFEIYETDERSKETYLRGFAYIAGYADAMKDVLKILREEQQHE